MKRLVATFLVTTLVILSITLFLLQMGIYSCNAAFYMEEDFSVESVTEIYDNMLEQGFLMDNLQDMAEYYSRLKLSFMASDYMSTALLDGETLQTIWSGEETGIAVVKMKNESNEKYLNYQLEGEVPGEYRDVYMYVQNESMYSEVGTGPVDELVDIYIKDRDFKLGKVTLSEYNKNGQKDYQRI